MGLKMHMEVASLGPITTPFGLAYEFKRATENPDAYERVVILAGVLIVTVDGLDMSGDCIPYSKSTDAFP